MTDDERRAEIEAVARELWPGAVDTRVWQPSLRRAARAIAALDRVRDARGNDEGCCPYCHEPVEDGPAFVDGETGRSLWHHWCWNHDQTMSGLSPEEAARERKRARSPQGEDHETTRPEIEAVARAIDHYLRFSMKLDNWKIASTQEMAAQCITALDRVRGDAEAGGPGYRLAAIGTPPPDRQDHETARPEQPPPDTLGGQPPAEPPDNP